MKRKRSTQRKHKCYLTLQITKIVIKQFLRAHTLKNDPNHKTKPKHSRNTERVDYNWTVPVNSRKYETYNRV